MGSRYISFNLLLGSTRRYSSGSAKSEKEKERPCGGNSFVRVPCLRIPSYKTTCYEKMRSKR